jgi:hypothetical protein
MACTNSCRAPALILGIVPPFVCHAPVANFVRQRDLRGNKTGDAMRPARIIDVDHQSIDGVEVIRRKRAA